MYRPHKAGARHRPKRTKLDKPLIESAVQYAKAGVPLDATFRRLGVGRSTFRQWMAHGRELRELIDKGDRIRITRAEELMLSLADSVDSARYEFMTSALANLQLIAKKTDSWTGYAWLLERSFPDLFGRTIQQVEIADNAAVRSPAEIVEEMIARTIGTSSERPAAAQ